MSVPKYQRDVFSAHAESLSKISARMVRHSEVLELGPASGYFTRILRDVLDSKVDAIEIDPEMAEKARPYCRDIAVADLDRVDWNKLWPGRKYDAIVAADVLEHLRDPERVLRALLTRIKPNGKLLISLPNIAYAGMIFGLLEDDFRYRTEGLLDRTHLKFFTRTTLEEMLTSNGWSIRWRGEVTKDLYEAEFRTRLEAWPEALRDYVVRHPSRRAYQLLCECTPNSGATAQAPIETDAGASAHPTFALRMMWADRPEGLCYEQGETAFARIGVPGQRIAWTLPQASTTIRIRLTDRVGFLRNLIINISAPHTPAQEVPLVQCVWSDDVGLGTEGIMLGSAESWLTLPTFPYEAGTRVELTLDWPMSADFHAASQNLRTLRAGHDAHLQAITRDLTQAREAAVGFEQKMLEREALVATRDEAIAARDQHLAHLEALVKERERLIVERDALLQDSNGTIQSLSDQRSALQAQLATMHSELENNKQEIAVLKSVRGWLNYRMKRKHRD